MKLFDFLLDELETSYFDCFTQQICSICYFFYNEYWKLFLDEKVIVDINNDNHLLFQNNILQAAERYYSVEIKKIDKNIHLCKDNIYIIVYPTKYYKYSSLIEDGKHTFVVYNIENGYADVHDNFYKVKDFKINLKELESNLISVYNVKKNTRYDTQNEISLDDLFDSRELLYNHGFYNNLFDVLSKYEIDPLLICEYIKNLYSQKKRDSMIIKAKACDLPFYIEIGNLFDMLSQKWKRVWFTLLKKCINGKFRVNEIESKTELLIRLEKIIYDEISDNQIWNFLLNETERLTVQGIMNIKVYDYFTSFTLLEFINEIENIFDIEVNIESVTKTEDMVNLIGNFYELILDKKAGDYSE